MSRNLLYVAPVIHASTGLNTSITNLAKLDTLNGEPIKTGKEISFSSFSSLSSVDAIVAFLVKFNPAVESLDCSRMTNLQSKCRRFHVAPMLHLTSFSQLCLRPSVIASR